MDLDRKARLKALREAAAAEGAVEEPTTTSVEPTNEPAEPVLKFRNYNVKDEKIEHEKVEAAKAPEFEEIQVEATGLLGDDAEEVLINVAPKKANWDLRRDIATKLALLERRTQTAMIQLMQQEEKHRLEEAGGIQD